MNRTRAQRARDVLCFGCFQWFAPEDYRTHEPVCTHKPVHREPCPTCRGVSGTETCSICQGEGWSPSTPELRSAHGGA